MGAKVMNKKDICKKKLRFFIFYHYSGIIIQKKRGFLLETSRCGR